MSAIKSIANSTILLTGAAGGIGSELARRLVGRGANVSLLDVDGDGLTRLADELGDRTARFECDITSWTDLEAAVSGTIERFGGIDVVVANAGDVDVASVGGTDPERFERVVEVNLLGTWRTVRSCLSVLIERQGYVLLVSSLAGDLQGPLHAAYNASKAGIQAFANTLRLEVQGFGMDVGVASLMYVDTPRARWAVDHPAMKALSMRMQQPRSVSQTTEVARRQDVPDQIGMVQQIDREPR